MPSYIYLCFLVYIFYTAVTFDPEALSENLQKNGAFIPGIVQVHQLLATFQCLKSYHPSWSNIFRSMAILPLIMQFITGNTSLRSWHICPHRRLRSPRPNQKS